MTTVIHKSTECLRFEQPSKNNKIFWWISAEVMHRILYYTLFNTPDFCAHKQLKTIRKSWSSFIIIRVSGVQVPPPLPNIQQNQQFLASQAFGFAGLFCVLGLSRSAIHSAKPSGFLRFMRIFCVFMVAYWWICANRSPMQETSLAWVELGL